MATGLSISSYISQVVAGQPRKPSPIHDALQAIQTWASSGLTTNDLAANAGILASQTVFGTFVPWTDYTAGIAVAGGTVPTYTGKFITRYMQVGKIVTVFIWWQNTAAGTAGAGGAALTFNLPVTAAQNGATFGSSLTVGTLSFYNGSTADQGIASVNLNTTTTAQLVQQVTGTTYANVAGGNQNNVSRYISGSFSYEAP